MDDQREYPHSHIQADPKAVALARADGMARHELQEILYEAAARNPMALIGGYHIDLVILALWIALRTEEDLTPLDIHERIAEAIRSAWAGLI